MEDGCIPRTVSLLPAPPMSVSPSALSLPLPPPPPSQPLKPAPQAVILSRRPPPVHARGSPGRALRRLRILPNDDPLSPASPISPQSQAAIKTASEALRQSLLA
eukprot:GILK01011409.1.p1 GENE.GILK01011409.1~~GILK01011409.1.p1  ORF type:complete len:114 (-),score=4.76 GILK01011409.1:223-534(-)